LRLTLGAANQKRPATSPGFPPFRKLIGLEVCPWIGSTVRKLRIWDYEEIAKNTGPSYDKVPDSAMRSGETHTEWRLRMLLRDLQALAADPETLIRAYDPRIPVADDLVNDFDAHLELAERCVEEGLIAKDMLDKSRVVLEKISEMSKRHDPSLWTNNALRTHPDWLEVRRRALEALRAMGYDFEPPPPRSM